MTSAIYNVISQINEDENVLWAGMSHKSCLLYEAIFNRGLLFACGWALFDFLFFSNMLILRPNIFFLGPIIFFLVIHMFPVWIFIAGIITTMLSYNNTCYVITDKAIHYSTGIRQQIIEARPHSEIRKITLKKNFFDRLYNIGDVTVLYKHKGFYRITREGINIHNIPEYNKVYDLMLDIKTKVKEEEKISKLERLKLKKTKKD